MGRKPKAARVEGGTSNMAGTFNPSSERVENDQLMKNAGSTPAKKKAAKNKNLMVRRSGRLSYLTSRKPSDKNIVEEIDLVDNDGQDEPRLEQLSNELEEPDNEDNEGMTTQPSTEPISNQQGLDEKIDFLVQCVKEFKSQAKKRSFPSETHEFAELNYKTLYIDSQKKVESLVDENHELATKVESLVDENHQLTRKLEFALGEVKAYEQMKDVFGNLKDFILFSNLVKANEALLNLLSQNGSPIAGAANKKEKAKGSPGKGKRG